MLQQIADSGPSNDDVRGTPPVLNGTATTAAYVTILGDIQSMTTDFQNHERHM